MDFGRLIKIFTNPKEYWNEMVAEPGEIKSLLIPQMLILAAIPALCSFLGMMLGMLGIASKLGIFGRLFAGAVVGLVLGYAMNIGIWILMGVIINALAQPFGAQKDFSQSMKLATGTIIPMWAGSVLHITSISLLGMLGALAGLGYGAYFLYLGLPIMNGCPQEKAVGYTAATIGIMVVISIVVAFVVACPMGCLMASAMLGPY